MNVFLPFESFEKCAQALDDKRLTKQILECKQIIFMNEHKEKNPDYVNSYLNHPVVKHYKSQTHQLVEYALAMCKEFKYRFGKQHAYYEFFVHRMTKKTCEFVPLYAEGSISSSLCIRETSLNSVMALFRLKLIRKWNNDILNGRPPKWTNRKRPNFEGEN